jgi:hypothetical protein
MTKFQLRRDWYRPVKKSRLHRRLDEVYLVIRRSAAPGWDPCRQVWLPATSAILVGKAYRSGFYWPTAMADAKDLVKRCKGCQFFAKQQHLPAQVLRTIPPSWPFAMWDLDSVGTFWTAPGSYRFILVSIKKFTKRIEVWPVAKVTSEEVAKFMQDITHRFGVPNRIITDLGTTFTGSAFWDFCQDNTIDVYHSSVERLKNRFLRLAKSFRMIKMLKLTWM